MTTGTTRWATWGTVGKWHMGDEDLPQRGFDHWVAFRGQGTYYPDGHGTSRVVPQTRYDGHNVNGESRRPQEGYITDELTDLAIDWLGERKAKDKPFFLYLSHKAVHSDFVPRDAQKDLYQDAAWSVEAADLPTPAQMDGASFWKSARGIEQAEWDNELLYEYYWEWNYPQTPTVHALRTGRYKYIRYYGVWDSDELYDLEADPEERRNLIREPAHAARVASMKKRLFEKLAESHGHDIPLLPDRGRQFFNRHPERAKQAPFPKWYYEEMVPVTE